MLKKTVKMASEKVEVVSEPEILEEELYPGVKLQWKRSVNITDAKLQLLENLLDMLLGGEGEPDSGEPEKDGSSTCSN